MVTGDAFAKTICSICYEDLKPIVEDLQSISVCGHVFHELCLQQWFEYCSNGKKNSCPVCKQACSKSNVGRLYFQSVGDVDGPNDLSQKPRNCEKNFEELSGVVKRLEGKVLVLSSTLECQQKELKGAYEELSICEEQIKKETNLRNEALKQKMQSQQLLHKKSEELGKSTLECKRLHEKNTALAKELAALKLGSDLNLDEEDVLKFSSLGNETNYKEMVDVLRKSLVIRNKSYKELMAKCNALGRGETRSLRKLEKAKEKIQKLKIRVQELETSVELKDNAVLRSLKASKENSGEIGMPKNVGLTYKYSFINTCPGEDQMKERSVPTIDLDEVRSPADDLISFKKPKKFKPTKDMARNSTKADRSVPSLGQETVSTSNDEILHHGLTPQIVGCANVEKCSPERSKAAFDTENETQVRGRSIRNMISYSESFNKGDSVTVTSLSVNEDVELLPDDNAQVKPFLRIKTDIPPQVPLSQPGDFCFAGGLLGPDGTSNWHLGKWCKRVQSKGLSATLQGSTSSSSNLIGEGADGRGGRIKVLRSLNHSSLDYNNTSALGKRCKYGAKSSALQSQIEHFFGRASQ